MIGAVLRIRYELQQEIDETPLFRVYRGRDRVTGRDVTVRVLEQPFSREPAFIQALTDAIGKTASANHPGVERFIEIDEEDGVVFLVSEYTSGQILTERIRRLAPFSAPVAVGLGISLCEALLALHREGVIHGDVSARNIVIGADSLPRLLLPGVWESYSASRTAGSVMLPEMAAYLAPEISAGEMPSAATDVYAVGVLLYQLLTGRDPYPGDTAVSIALKHSTAPVPSIRLLNPGAPQVLDEIVKKSLAKSPADRYPDIKALLADLRMLQDALRFGKSLKWPIASPVVNEAPVAPKMNAVPEPKKVKPRKERPVKEVTDDSDELPRWLMAMVYVCVAAIVLAAGGWVFFNLNKPKDVQVPDLVKLSVSEANARLGGVGLKMKVGRREPSDKIMEGCVIESNPEAGDLAREGGSVTVVVSTGAKFVTVPDLKGRSLAEARSILGDLNLSLEEPPRRERHSQIAEGLVISQLPEARRKVERGSSIRVTVSSGRSSGTSASEDELNTYTLKITLKEGDLPVVVRVDMTDARETKTVYEESHNPADSFTVSADGYGDEVTFRIFYDNDLVKQVVKKAESP